MSAQGGGVAAEKFGGGDGPPPLARPGDPPVTLDLAQEHGLTGDEYDRILRLLGRTPTFTELGVFSAMWSEHCGYKHSKRMLRTLPVHAPWVIQGPGENAGVVDVGDGYALVFKIESHNHPSAVEPYQGAATGIGGILRDIFTMGARPVATLNSLRFGDLDRPRARYLLRGVVKGLGDYGNCVGIPCIGGETHFDRGYRENPLVNAMCLGLAKRDSLARGLAQGEGNTLMAVGARTGRDGIHGATFASEELSEESGVEDRPRVQVGDPFTEKLLLEASLELIEAGCVTGIQDMGAAGLTSSGVEMAARAGSGVELDAALVPVREEGMTPYEVLLSESQERMLLVARPGRESDIERILGKWELEAARIGRVTSDGAFRVMEEGRPVVDIPARLLTEGCPLYEIAGKEDPRVARQRQADLSPYLETTHPARDLLRLLASPAISSKQWVYEQYDTTVRGSAWARPGASAGVIGLPGGKRGVAATTDCNGRHAYLNPRTGGRGAVAEAARNLACAGALPIAVTNCLNFGNPTKPAIYFQFREAVRGMGEACAFFETPVTGGNVSFYNETDGQAVRPSPVIGMVGVVEDASWMTPHAFQREGDVIVLLGRNRGELGGSEYLYAIHGEVAGEPPKVSLTEERALQHAMLHLARSGAARSAHDVSSGGLAVTLAECCMGLPTRDGTPPLGAKAELSEALQSAALLFGEDHGRIVVSCAEAKLGDVLETAQSHHVPAARIGRVARRGDPLTIKARGVDCAVSGREMRRSYFDAIPRIMEASAR